MNNFERFERAKFRARELDKLHPDFTHTVNLRLKIIRWKKTRDD